MAKTAVYVLTRQGLALGERLARALAADLFAPQRLAGGARGFTALLPLVARTFRLYDRHVFVTAAGIAVRAVGPLLADKTNDPAVAVLSQDGRFAVSLAGGHLGGANELARELAALTGGQAVITTATDVMGLPALDEIAGRRGLVPREDSEGAAARAYKGLAAALLEGRPVQAYDPEDRLGLNAARLEAFVRVEDPRDFDPDEPGVYVDFRAGGEGPGVFWLCPRCLAAGVGCRRGTPAEEILSLLVREFDAAGLCLESLAVLASIEAKRDEPGLLAAARRLGVGAVFFPARELSGIKTASDSERVRRRTGVGCVCEAAAILAAEGGELVLGKRTGARTTLAVARTARPSRS